MTSYSFNWPEPSGREPAPGRLRSVQQFVNTYDVEDAHDHIATHEAASAWFRSEQLATRDVVQDADDLAMVWSLRRHVRGLLANESSVEPVESPLTSVRTELRFKIATNGTISAELDGDNLNASFGRLILAIRDAELTGNLERLKICDADPCRWAYWDHSRNRSSRWCSMDLCGNRQKAQRNRRRVSDLESD